MVRAVNIARENLISVGTCFGKFNKAGNFKLHITALTYLAPYAKVRDEATMRSYSRSCIAVQGLAQAEC